MAEAAPTVTIKLPLEKSESEEKINKIGFNLGSAFRSLIKKKIIIEGDGESIMSGSSATDMSGTLRRTMSMKKQVPKMTPRTKERLK